MSGGVAWVLDLDEGRVNDGLVELRPVEDEAAEELRTLVERHQQETGSTVAEALLADWPASLARFTEVMPSDYKRVLEAREEALEEGLDEDEANQRIMEVLHG
jgi:glutamate synthase (NADPH/NADH) large chain